MTTIHQSGERIYIDFTAYNAWWRSIGLDRGELNLRSVIISTGNSSEQFSEECIECKWVGGYDSSLGDPIPVRFILPGNQPRIVQIESASVDGASYIPYVHKYIVRQRWQRAMLETDGCATLEEALETALYWMNNPSFWVNALAVRRSDGVMVAWTEESYLPDLLNQIAKNGAEPPR